MNARRFVALFLVGGPILGAVLAYTQCAVRGICRGDCIATGYDVGSVCLALALKTWLALSGALLVTFFVWRRGRAQ